MMQKLLWAEPEQSCRERAVGLIPRETIIEALALLGIDADEVRRVEMGCTYIEVERMVLDVDGKMQIDPCNPDEVWTTTDIYGVS